MKFFLPVHQDIGPIGPDRNWKGIGISLLVIMAVLSCIGLSIVLLSQGEPMAAAARLLRLFPVNNSFAVLFLADVFMHSRKYLISFSVQATFKATKFAVSPDKKFVLLGYNVQPPLWVLHAVRSLSREVWELNPPEVPDSVLQFASWGVQGQQLLYVFENNIYYQADSRSFSWRLTSSGQEAAIFNGIADWLYEEEVLDSPVAHWWSPDGSRLAYLTINDSLVPSMMLPRFTGSLYPRGTEYPYPKVGSNPCRVSVYKPNNLGSSLLLFACLCSDFYVTMVKWVTRQNLSVRWVNRAQNMSILSLCDASSGACVTKHVMTSEAWLDRQVRVLDGSSILSRVLMSHVDESAAGCGSFLFLNRFFFQKGSSWNIIWITKLQLTSGSWDVSEVLSYDENSRSVDSAPGGRVVSERFSLGWESVLVSSDRVVVARVDGRGSAGRGQDVLQAVYQNLGVVDVQDQIAALQRLMKLPYIDRSRVGVYGKAYGGFLSSVLLLTFSSMIKCGVAVAPVTNWKLCGEETIHPTEYYLLLFLFFLLLTIFSVSASVHFQHSAELVQLLSARNFNYTLQVETRSAGFCPPGEQILTRKFLQKF
uniref:Dipeptidylpeptidase IV N-terminal domain-containing protein n=1 Tax=Poecilia latipinna TaxID=48699 RepID=A0A3B3VH63_9TELE